MLAVAASAPCSRLDVVLATTAPASSPRRPPQRYLDTLAAKTGEKCGLESAFFRAPEFHALVLEEQLVAEHILRLPLPVAQFRAELV